MKLLLLVLILLSAPGTGVAEQPFSVHTVAAGETLTAIAGRYGASPGDIASANGLAGEEKLPPAGTVMLIPGSPEHVLSTLYEAKRRGLGGWPKPRGGGEFLEPLALPSSGGQQNESTPPPPTEGNMAKVSVKAGETARGEPQGRTYTVRAGDTLYRIAKNGGISLADLMEANGLNEGSVIRAGDVLALPQPMAPLERPGEAELEAAPPPAAAEAGFHPRWPLRTGTGASRTARGSGIFEAAVPGTAVYAPAPGTVLHSGWMKEYGNAVFIRHGDEFATFCGGLGTFYVKPGQSVTSETKIGLVGEGTGPGLTFHLLRNGKTVDPALFLGTSAEP